MAHRDDDSLGEPSHRAVRDFISRFRVTSGKGFALKDHPTRNPDPDFVDKIRAPALLERGREELSSLQEKLYAESRWSLLLVFQAMDAAGKDSTIKHVMTGVNPQGVDVTSFKQPGPDDLAPRHPVADLEGAPGARHDRHLQPLALRGGAGRARPSRDPGAPATACAPRRAASRFWDHRLESIANFEKHFGPARARGC